MRNSIASITLFLILQVFVWGCANMQPPSGGEDDKEPPKAVKIYPLPNTTNFSGNSISIKFDEYVDRRSFSESFFATPKPDGEVSFSWSGKEVEVEFSKPLKSNTTYLFIVGKLLKDIHGNTLNAPIQFAVSTGSKIDKGKLSGRVYSKNYDRVYVFAYKLEKNNSPDPSKDHADYMIPVNNDGVYSTSNLSAGKYRLFTVFDNDRNGLYDKELEEISCTDRDYDIDDENAAVNCNFLMKNLIVDKKYYSSKEFYNNLKSDSSSIVFSNIINGQKNTGVNSRMFFYFKNKLLTREYFASNTTLTDTLHKKIRTVFNWMNDSLLEVIPTGNYTYGTSCIFTIDLSKIKSSLIYSLKFTAAEENKSSDISGRIKNRAEIQGTPVLSLINSDRPEQNFTIMQNADSLFVFSGIVEGDYYFYSFIDSNGDGEYNNGETNPFKPAEKFFFFGKKINVKGGWKVENLIVEF
ncbi:MAG: Ig-like domain-containing protein [Ignavibacteria bacterium]|nr:Ig-like domain-containing protein [Ignavibacteria bacterium]